MKPPLRILAVLVLLLGILAVAATAQEETTGTIEGTVRDTEGMPLAGVTVIINSVQGSKTETTDESGRFRFKYLQAGPYRVSASLSGYTGLTHPRVDVHLGARIRVDMTMQIWTMDTVEIVATPIVDITSTTTGATFTEELTSKIPLGRSFSNTLALAPGVVGGGIDDSNPSIGGASGLENTYVVDGVSINNAGYGSVGSYSIVLGSLGTGVNFDYIEEIQVKTGGYEPEYGEALGGFVNLVTKTGGNEHRGSAFIYGQGSGLEGDRKRTDRENATFDDTGFQSTDFGFELGGPVVQDKMFYFGAFDPTFLKLSRRSAEATGFEHEVDVDRSIYNYAANMKWAATPKHSIIVSAFGDPSTGDMGPQREDALAVADPSQRFSEITYGGNNFVTRWSGELLDNSFIEASFAYHQDKFEEDLAVNQPSGTDFTDVSGVPVRYGGVGFYANSKSTNAQYRVKFSSFFPGAGQHNLRYGVEYQDVGYNNTSTYSGPPGTVIPDFVDDTGTPVGTRVATSGYDWQLAANSDSVLYPSGQRFRIRRIRSGELTAETENHHLAFFLSDSWNPVEWVDIMAGIRYEENTLIGSAAKFSWDNNWGPRFHVTVDPTKDHKTKLSFAFGRFFGKIPNDLAVRALSTEITHIVSYDRNDVDLTDPNNPVIPDPSLAKAMTTFGDVPTVVDPKSKVTFQDEYIVSAERYLLPYVNVGLSYTYRNLGRTLEDVALVAYSDLLAGAEFGEYFITNPTPEQGFPKPSRKYNAVTLKAEKHSSEDQPWQVAGSYTWARLKGNYEGYYRRDNGQSDPFITSLFDFPYLLDPDVFQYIIEDGLLPNDHAHTFNLFGSYTLPMGLTLGTSVRVQTGMPLTRLGHNEAYGDDGEIPLEERGASGRSPTTTDIGLHADYGVNAGGRKISLIADVFNLLNQQKGNDFDQEYEVGGVGLVSDDFGKPKEFEDPLSVRFALRVEQ
jgi:hypothetical protein